MKSATAFVIFIIFCIKGSSQKWVRAEDAANHKGDTINLAGFISNINYGPDRGGLPILMTIKGKDSSNFLLLVVLESDRQKFIKDIESTYKNQYVQVKGQVEMYKGNTALILRNQNQISIAREDVRPID